MISPIEKKPLLYVVSVASAIIDQNIKIICKSERLKEIEAKNQTANFQEEKHDNLGLNTFNTHIMLKF